MSKTLEIFREGQSELFDESGKFYTGMHISARTMEMMLKVINELDSDLQGLNWEFDGMQEGERVLRVEKKELNKSIDIKDKIIHELHKTIENLGGLSDILSITGSYKDTLDDCIILDMLKSWNQDFDLELNKRT